MQYSTGCVLYSMQILLWYNIQYVLMINPHRMEESADTDGKTVENIVSFKEAHCFYFAICVQHNCLQNVAVF